MSATTVSVLGLLSMLTLTALAYAAPVIPPTAYSILSLATAGFLRLSADGNIYADGHFGKFSKRAPALTPNSSFF